MVTKMVTKKAVKYGKMRLVTLFESSNKKAFLTKLHKDFASVTKGYDMNNGATSSHSKPLKSI